MSSYDIGKDVVCAWVRENFPKDSKILDVGACNGLWKRLLREYTQMDAVEIFPPNIAFLGDYRDIYNMDIYDFTYDWYDLIIFGDVIEHMSVERAQKVLTYASKRCGDMIVVVPFLYTQGVLYGNLWERHIQDDLTAELVAERYPMLEVLHDTKCNYCYYHLRGD